MSCLIEGCLVRTVQGNQVVFTHSWGGLLIVLLGMLVSGVVFVWGWNQRNALAGKIGAFAFMTALMLALFAAPGRLMDRIEMDPAGISIRHMSLWSLHRNAALWNKLSEVRVGRNGSGYVLMMYDKGLVANHVSVDLDTHVIDTISPDIARFAAPHGVQVVPRL